MQMVHSSKNKFLREIFQVEMTPPSLGRGTIRHLGVDQAYKVGFLGLGYRNNSFLLPSTKLWLLLTSSFFCTVSANSCPFHSTHFCKGVCRKSQGLGFMLSTSVMSALSPRTASLEICVAMPAGCHRSRSDAASPHVVINWTGLLCACPGIRTAPTLPGWV